MTGTDVDPRTMHHAALRPLLFTVAYEILGSATDADDVVRQCLWESPRCRSEVGSGDGRPHLTAAVVRIAVDALALRRRAAGDYTGPWLPEPIRFDDDPMTDAGLAEAVSTALLVVLEELEPEARAVYVLREVFGFGADAIAAMLPPTVGDVERIAEQARSLVERRRPRFDPVDRARAAQIVDAFLAAAESGDAETLLTLMTPDVVLTSDSDGKTTAVRRPMCGAPAVMQVLSGFARIGAVLDDYRTEFAMFNGQPGMILYFDGRLQTALTLRVVDGLIDDIYVMRNPDKLGGVEHSRSVSR
ncbi:RNA polymerase subunit sigma-24 [Gordonia lacunae]|uniref:RNA polymerase subunit sigma-24 n=1 Tax=Gordonia lacunae TaxID=417102 RepID=UPI0039E5F637